MNTAEWIVEKIQERPARFWRATGSYRYVCFRSLSIDDSFKETGFSGQESGGTGRLRAAALRYDRKTCRASPAFSFFSYKPLHEWGVEPQSYDFTIFPLTSARSSFAREHFKGWMMRPFFLSFLPGIPIRHAGGTAEPFRDIAKSSDENNPYHNTSQKEDHLKKSANLHGA